VVFTHLRAFVAGCASTAALICIAMFNTARRDPDVARPERAMLYVLTAIWVLFLATPLLLLGGVIGVLIKRFVLR
jgi:predicted membrane channel-forming protein YqfA (hemolysin III family)